MNKPRIIILMHYMEIGGAESSLIGLLEALDPERVDVDLFVFAHHGVFMGAIPDYVNPLPEDEGYSMMEEPIVTVFKKGHPLIGFARLLAKWKTNRFYKEHPSEKDHSAGFARLGVEVGKVLHNLYNLGEYDLAISYNYPHNIVLDKVKAKKKIAWLHTDYRHISINKDLELPIWSRFDHIVSISPDVTTGFLFIMPELKDKMLECENILPKSYILSKAEGRLGVSVGRLALSEYRQANTLTLCSVGRISNAKNYDNIPYMAKELKELLGLGVSHSVRLEVSENTVSGERLEVSENGANEGEKTLTTNQAKRLTPNRTFRWFIIGPGDHSEIDKLSEKLGVKDNVIFLGPSDNPYPFIKNCDIYVHPSRYEGKSIVVREAQVLCKPVIITNYPTAHSQINDGVDGIICELDNAHIAKAIYSLATDKSRRDEIIRYLGTHDNAGMKEVNKIYKLLEQ